MTIISAPESAAAFADRLDRGHYDEFARELAIPLVRRGVEHDGSLALGFAGVVLALLNLDGAPVVTIDNLGELAAPLEAAAKAVALD
ncbi:hypothetical protein [Streptomyces hydrogenans]|uniref:hypothetical protein n=1 Tax=Streptomyces hydrogenans TaxID=1873719 RepID=UPI0037F6F795